jgi:hypothetical protein
MKIYVSNGNGILQCLLNTLLDVQCLMFQEYLSPMEDDTDSRRGAMQNNGHAESPMHATEGDEDDPADDSGSIDLQVII